MSLLLVEIVGINHGKEHCEGCHVGNPEEHALKQFLAHAAFPHVCTKDGSRVFILPLALFSLVILFQFAYEACTAPSPAITAAAVMMVGVVVVM